MGEFLNRLLSSSTGPSNYTFGLNRQTIFYEIDIDEIDRPRGMNITVVITAADDEEARVLLRELVDFPFKQAGSAE